MSLLNINVGVMGHVDCGKTSLCKKISEVASTAAFDKNPQSQERGITIDLGFSSFKSIIPFHLNNSGYENIQITLVDCPGHASLFKTVIGGSKIIDMILLVIDITHGIQIQTAECIILAEIMQKPVLVVLNKIDLLDKSNNDKIIQEKEKIAKILSKTQLKMINIVSVSIFDAERQVELKNMILKSIEIPIRSDGPFLFCVDHCFSIKGKGTIMTGTVIQGILRENEEVLIIDYNEVKEVKSIQVFKKAVERISQGDRAGISITRFNSSLIERSLICSPKFPFKHFSTIITKPVLIKHYKYPIKSNSKVLVSVGFEIISANIIFYEKIDNSIDQDCQFVEFINHETNLHNIMCLIKTEKSLIFLDNSLVIGLNLAVNQIKKTCRIMFYGSSIPRIECENQLKNLKVYVHKIRTGRIEKENAGFIIVKDIFSAKSNIQKHIGQRVSFSVGGSGIIDSNFGTSGKIKISVDKDEIPEVLKAIRSKDIKTIQSIEVIYKFKKYHKISRFT